MLPQGNGISYLEKKVELITEKCTFLHPWLHMSDSLDINRSLTIHSTIFTSESHILKLRNL